MGPNLEASWESSERVWTTEIRCLPFFVRTKTVLASAASDADGSSELEDERDNLGGVDDAGGSGGGASSASNL